MPSSAFQTRLKVMPWILSTQKKDLKITSASSQEKILNPFLYPLASIWRSVWIFPSEAVEAAQKDIQSKNSSVNNMRGGNLSRYDANVWARLSQVEVPGKPSSRIVTRYTKCPNWATLFTRCSASSLELKSKHSRAYWSEVISSRKDSGCISAVLRCSRFTFKVISWSWRIILSSLRSIVTVFLIPFISPEWWPDMVGESRWNSKTGFWTRSIEPLRSALISISI